MNELGIKQHLKGSLGYFLTVKSWGTEDVHISSLSQVNICPNTIICLIGRPLIYIPVTCEKNLAVTSTVSRKAGIDPDDLVGKLCSQNSILD